MFGTLRLVLAFLVGLSHTGYTVAGFNPGVFAVVIFFLISGYVTSSLLSAPNAQPLNFYAERLVRLMPSYWTLSALTAAVWWLLAPESPFLSHSPEVWDWLANLTVIPLNYYMWTGGQERFTLLPAAWSLGLELQFYLVAPWLLRRRVNPSAGLFDFGLLLIVFALSSAFYLVASLPRVMNADVFGYRLLPGVLWIFLAGSFLHRRQYAFAAGAWLVAFTALVCLSTHLAVVRPFNMETAAGICVGIPLVACLARLRRRPWDEFLADLAYPFFLSHFTMLWVFEWTGAPSKSLPDQPILLLAWTISTLTLSWSVFRLTEKPLNAWRRRLRPSH